MPKHVPRAEIDAGIPSEVTFAPSVAPVAVIEEIVGVEMVGAVLAGETATVVHDALQLLFSSDSAMTPPPADEVLSVQARTEYVPDVVNVYKGEDAGRLAEIPSAAIPTGARSVIVPPPFIAVAT